MDDLSIDVNVDRMEDILDDSKLAQTKSMIMLEEESSQSAVNIVFKNSEKLRANHLAQSLKLNRNLKSSRNYLTAARWS